MRIFFFACALIAQGVCTLSAQSISDIVKPNERYHDFGAVPKASKAEHRFSLHNPFNTEIQIQGVRASCGCTTPILETRVIKPGETGYLTAKFNTDRFNGEKKATLTVSISKPYFTELQLNVKGYIRTDIVLHPGEAAFGGVLEGTSQRLSLDLSYAGRNDWQILNIVSPYPFLKAGFQEVARGGGRVQYTLDFELDGSAPEGFLANPIVIHTNDHRLKSFPIQFTASVEKPVQVSPPKIALGRVKPNESIPQRITVTSKNSMEITELSSDIAEVRYESPNKSSRVHLINMLVTPKVPKDQLEGELVGTIFIKTDMSDDPIKIPLSFMIEIDKLAEVK